MKFYKRDPDKALAGMAELTLQQRGGYNSLIDLLYARDGDVPDDDARVARMIYCHRSEWKAVKRHLMATGKVWVEDGKLHAKRVQTTIKEATNFGQTQRKRVSNRWQKAENQNENNDPPIRAGNTNIAIATATAIETRSKKDSRGRAASPRATRWPHDCKVPSEWMGDAQVARLRNMLPEVDVMLEAEKFANFWSAKSGANATKIDWHKTWINWALRAEAPRHGNKTTAHDKFLAAGLSLIVNNIGDKPAGDSAEDDSPDGPGRPLLPP
jgi:uncharacterized protein YdaU (DUF1376 family)